MDKSLLIVSDNPTGELASAFERALRFLPDEKYKIEMVSHEFNWKKPPKSTDILLILDTNPQDSSYSSGIGFLRKFWATGLKQNLPQTILLSFDTPQKLFQKDTRHVVILLEGVEHITIPAKLEDIIEKIKNSPARPNVEMAKEYLKLSCELGFERRIEHARRNFIGPYSLILGARYVDDVTQDDFNRVITSLESREASDELIIYDAVIRNDIKTGDIGDAIEKMLKGKPLSEVLKGKKILLIDDEYESAGWKVDEKAESNKKGVFDVIFGGGVIEAIGKKWPTAKDVLEEKDINEKLNFLSRYDLILLDLYLTEQDNKKKGDEIHHLYKYSGLQLLEKIRKKEDAIPVILFTASNKAFNVKAAEKIGIDGYFQKEGRYQSEDEAVAYYAEFKNLIKNTTCQERKALREVWRGINKCMDINYISDMKDAYELLSSYIKTPKSVYPSSSINRLGSLIEKIYGEKNPVINSVDKILRNITISTSRNKRIKDLHAFIAYWLRHSAAHSSSQITFADALFTFFAVLKALGIDLTLDWEDPCPIWSFDTNMAEAMINSICNENCTNECCSFLKKDLKLMCNGKEIIKKKKKDNEWVSLENRVLLTLVNKAKFLLLAHNLNSNQAKNNQVIFRYLFYALCLKEMGQEISQVVLPLIKFRFTHGGDFNPPFKDGFWVGIKMDDGSIDSPLGTLKPGMFKNEKTDGDKMLFQPTEKYLREGVGYFMQMKFGINKVE